jgi:hypothetical protein
MTDGKRHKALIKMKNKKRYNLRNSIFPGGIMKKRVIAVLMIVLINIASVGCSPSKEALATRTVVQATTIAAGWTLTPTITTTPSPTITPTKTITPTPDPRYYDKNGGFSFIPPENWVGEPAKTLDADKSWYFPNINVCDCELFFLVDNYTTEEPWSWADQMLVVYEQNAPGYKFIYKKHFPTEYFPNGYTFAYFIYLQGSYRVTDYMFAKDEKFVTASFLCAADKVNVELQDASMKTLRYT